MANRIEWQLVSYLRMVEVDENGTALLLRQQTPTRVLYRETLREGDDPTQLAIHSDAYTRCLAVQNDVLAEVEWLDEADIDALAENAKS